MKFKQFVLTCAESKEFTKTGRCVHSYGGIGYKIEADEQGKPHVVGLVPLAEVEYEIIVRR